MCVLAGVVYFDRRPICHEDRRTPLKLLSLPDYGLSRVWSNPGISHGYANFSTCPVPTAEQLCVTATGTVAFDGRLDNANDLNLAYPIDGQFAGSAASAWAVYQHRGPDG